MEENKKENLSADNEKHEERDIFERTAQYDPLAKNVEKAEEYSQEINAVSGKLEGNIKIKSPFFAKLENFFYHYKWHTIIGAFFVFIVCLCIFQTCDRTSFDAYVLYAGGKNLRTIEANERDSTYEILYNATGAFVDDYDDDGERNLSMIDIYLPSPDEIKKLEEEGNVPYNLLKDNDDLFRNNMLSGNYYICFVSEYLFTEWTKDENNPFVPIASYLPEGAKIAKNPEDEGYLLASEYGVYLHSTPAADNPGYKYLPEDTVICLRKYSATAAPGKKGKTMYANAEKTFRLILKDETYS